MSEKSTVILLLIVVPVLILVGFVIMFAVWSLTGPVIGLLAAAGLLTAGASIATALQRRNRPY